MNENNDRKQNIIIVLLITSLVFSYVMINGKTQMLESRIMNLNNQITDLNRQMNNLGYSIQDEFALMQDEALNLIHFFDYNYVDMNEELNVVSVEVQVELKEKQNDSDLVLIVSDDSGKMIETKLNNAKGLHYYTTLDLGVDHNYSMNVIESAENNSRQLNRDTYVIDLQNQFEQRRAEPRTSESGNDQKSLFFNVHFSINDFGIEAFEIESATFVLENSTYSASMDSQSDESIYKEEVTSQLLKYSELSDQEKMLLAAGELLVERPDGFGTNIFTTTSSEETKKVAEKDREESKKRSILNDTSHEEYYVFQKVFIYDEFTEFDLKEMSDNIYGYLLIQFKDGTEIRL